MNSENLVNYKRVAISAKGMPDEAYLLVDAVSDGTIIKYKIPIVNIKKENFTKFETDMLDESYCAECEWIGSDHAEGQQAVYDELCEMRRMHLSHPCIGCKSRHYDEAYIGGFQVNTDNSSGTWILHTGTGLKIPVEAEVMNKILDLGKGNFPIKDRRLFF